MPFIPHTEQEIAEMLAAIGVESIEDLFSEIPANIRARDLTQLPQGLPEMRLARLMQTHADSDREQLNFIGAGSYQHHIPAAVWDVVARGEYMTAYTPYQAEASQGSLQLIYEYQTMMASLMALEVSNASLYDGASALAEAVLMAVRSTKKATRAVLVLGAVAPAYQAVVNTIVKHQKITVTFAHPEVNASQNLDVNLSKYADQDFAAVVIPQPNFFGSLQAVDTLTDWAHQKQALVIALVNPTAMALIKAPGEWGRNGADIACGEGQPLGVPMASGGPYFGFLCCKQQFVRQMPGRIVGRTVDVDGKPGFCLTLQAREQHIRRSKATSNICTNQGLLVTAATIYMSLLGPEGLRRVAVASHNNAVALTNKLASAGIEVLSRQPIFHEFVVRLPKPVAPLLAQLAVHNIQAGYDLSAHFPELGNALLICSTEVHTADDHETLVEALSVALKTANKSAALV